MIQSGEDAAEREEASWWAGRDPEMEIFRMVCPDVDAACLGVLLGVAVIRRVGSFGFLLKAYSQNCRWLRMNFLQNMKQKKKKLIPRKVFF